MAKTGRPKVENPKNIWIKARIDQETDDRLKAYCEKHKVSTAEMVREGVSLLLEKDR